MNSVIKQPDRIRPLLLFAAPLLLAVALFIVWWTASREQAPQVSIAQLELMAADPEAQPDTALAAAWLRSDWMLDAVLAELPPVAAEPFGDPAGGRSALRAASTVTTFDTRPLIDIEVRSRHAAVVANTYARVFIEQLGRLQANRYPVAGAVTAEQIDRLDRELTRRRGEGRDAFEAAREALAYRLESERAGSRWHGWTARIRSEAR